MYETIAMLTMLIDHIGLIFYPDTTILRIIGRLAMPLYTYIIVQGVIHTKDINKYFIRLYIIALISQLPYYYLSPAADINIVFTFAFLVLPINQWLNTKQRWIEITWYLIVAVFAHLYISYGYYAVILYLIYRIDRHQLVKHTVLNLVFIPLGWTIQLYSIAATAIIKYTTNLPLKKPWRYLYQAFYPVHLLILLFIKINSK